MLKPKRAYAIAALSVLVSRAISMVAGVFSLWLLTRILTVQDFASYAVAMSVVIFLGYCVGLGIERTLILRIANLKPQKDKLAGRTMMLRALAVVSGLSCLVTLILVLSADHHVLKSVSAAIADWVRRLAPVIPATAISLVLTAWFQANHRVGVSELMSGLNDGARCAFFAIAFAASMGPVAVALSAISAAFLPSLTLALLAKGKSQGPPGALYLRDVGVGLKFLAMRLAKMGLHQFDIISIGVISSSAETSQYVVASRVAAIAAIGQGAFLGTYAPRVRRHAEVGDLAAIAREYHGARVVSVLMTLAAAFVLFLFGRFALQFFGNFGDGYASLLILVAGHVVNASFGENITHLSMSGHLRASANIKVLAVLLFIILLIMLVPGYGGVGAAMSFFVASTIAGIIGSAVLQLIGGPPAFKPLFLSAAGSSSAALLVGAFCSDLWNWCILVLVATLMVVAIGERQLLGAILSDLARSKTNHPYD